MVFVVYPQAFVNMPVSQLWSVLFFFMMVCLGVDSEVLHLINRCDSSQITRQFQTPFFLPHQFALVDILITTLMDEFNVHLMKIFRHKEIFILFICIISFLIGIPCVLQVRSVFDGNVILNHFKNVFSSI